MARPPSRIVELDIGGNRLSLLPTIKGLDRERKAVREAVLGLRPSAVALPVSIEGLRGLRALYRGKKQEFFLSHYEQVYALKLSEHGKVGFPPPSFTEAYRACAEQDIPVKAIDMDEEDFADAFIENISGPSLMFHSVRWRWLKRKRFKARSAREFVLEWDRAVNSLKGFRHLEDRREEHQARQLGRLLARYPTVLAILELERMEGVLRRLRPARGPARNAGADEEE